MKKFDYYLKLRELGIKEKHAVAMTKQADKQSREDAADADNAADAIINFAHWNSTVEGEIFWDELHNKAQRG